MAICVPFWSVVGCNGGADREFDRKFDAAIELSHHPNSQPDDGTGDIGPEACRGITRKLTERTDEDGQFLAAYLAATYNCQSSEPALEHMATSASTSKLGRADAFEAIGKLGDIAAEPMLLAQVRSLPIRNAADAAAALASMDQAKGTQAAIDRLATASDGWSEREVASRLRLAQLVEPGGSTQRAQLVRIIKVARSHGGGSSEKTMNEYLNCLASKLKWGGGQVSRIQRGGGMARNSIELATRQQEQHSAGALPD